MNKFTIYVTAYDMHIHALDAVTGAAKWKQQILPKSASPTVSNGVVYVGGGGIGLFFAFDAVTGIEKWKLSIRGSLMTSPFSGASLRTGIRNLHYMNFTARPVACACCTWCIQPSAITRKRKILRILEIVTSVSSASLKFERLTVQEEFHS